MPYREHVMWSFVCDWSDCTADVFDGADHVALTDKDSVLEEMAHQDEWHEFPSVAGIVLQVCPDHWHWCENDEDEPRIGPADGCCMTYAKREN